ncbi:MAG: asparagine synthase (glutamine-hydrolyzing), partial [Dinghuibacter sp.]|nr:asparagine synthase (glutamine-hydrolyzing) [Dinghuibacter sp.]
RQLYCVRDQMGILPFFYTQVDDVFVFGSEIKALLEYPGVTREVDLVGLDQVFTFAGLVSPRTMFRNIHSLENGHYLRVDEQGNIHKHEYWDLDYPENGSCNGKIDEQVYTDRLEELFEQSIRLRLRADVPSGFYLSGGLDSSMIAMKVQQLLPGVRKDAFSIDFVESQYSESAYQKLVARESNAHLLQRTFFYNDICERLQHSVYHSECPIKETYNTASLVLSEAVRARGIKVIQSGEGGDELFAGYVGYRFDKMRQGNLVPDWAGEEEKRLRYELWGDEDFCYETNYLDFTGEKQQLYSDGINASFHEVNCLNYPLINRQKVFNRNILHRRAYIDYKIRLVDHLVSDHGDRMAMANSVEVRYPFLDKDLVEFSTRIPAELKLKDLEEKYILKKLAGRFVPKAVFEREKFHFIAPGSPYLLQKNVEFVQDLLSYSQIKRQGYFNPDQVEFLKKMYSEPGYSVNAPYETDWLIIVLTFGILLDTYFA